MKQRLYLALFCGALLLCGGCRKETAETPSPAPATPPAVEEPLLGFLAGLNGEEILWFDWYVGEPGVTAEELAGAVRAAAEHPVDHEPLTLNGGDTDTVWSMTLYLAESAPGVYSGEDGLCLWAGLEENVVEVFGGANLPEGRVWLEDETLYRLLRTMNDTPDGEIDQDAYLACAEAVDGYLGRALPGYGAAGVSLRRELTGFYPVEESAGLGAAVYCVADVIVVEPPEQAHRLLAGGDYVDSQLRIHPVGDAPQNLLVTIDGQAVGFVSWWWLESGGLAQHDDVQSLTAAVESGKL